MQGMCERSVLLSSQKQIDAAKDNPQKLLRILTAKRHILSELKESATPSSSMVVGNDGRFTYTGQSIRPFQRDREHWWIPMDHSYARPWNWRSENSFLRPTKTLFMPKPTPSVKRIKPPYTFTPVSLRPTPIDVVTPPEGPKPLCDKAKSKHVMGEAERHAGRARVGEADDEDWEDKISKVDWTPTMNRLFNTAIGILNTDRLARLTCAGSPNEPVLRRIAIDKSVNRMRRLMVTVSWNPFYTQWLHDFLSNHLSTSYLAIYLDILQTLKAKIPALVDKMISVNTSKMDPLSQDNLAPLLKNTWEPVASTLFPEKPKKLPGNSLIIVVPSTPISSKRLMKWINLLSNMTTVITMPSNYGNGIHKTTMMNCVDQMFVMTRNKIQDIRIDFPGKHLILAGFGFGASLALQLAQVEQVLCVLSIGFSLFTADGRRGGFEDNLLEIQCPVLFIIGQCSETTLQEDMEAIRERMRVETGLIVVGCADEQLRISKKKKKIHGITQSVVDRYIADEIGEFLSGVILSPYPPKLRQPPATLAADGAASKKFKSERKRYNSSGENEQQTPRIPRPGQNNTPNLGRPLGSKTCRAKIEARLEAKLAAAKGTSSSPSNSPPHISTNPPDTSSNDSNLTDKLTKNHETTPTPPVKKIKTLRPAEKSNQLDTTNQSSRTAKAALANRHIPGACHAFSDPQKVTPSTSGIKVLENVKIKSAVTPNMYANFANNDKPLDVPRISATNPKPPTITNINSIVLYPDGTIKNYTPCNVQNQGGSRYITSKRQLLNNKSQKTVHYFPQPIQSTFLPPTNLTTQDIMDLPIIFADDNQMIDNSRATPELKPAPQLIPTTSHIITNPGNRFVVLNNNNNKPGNFIISQTPKPVQPKFPTKVTKITVSKRCDSENSVLKRRTEDIMSFHTIFKDPMPHHNIIKDPMAHHNIIKDSMAHHNIIKDSMAHHHIIKDSMAHQNIIKDSVAHQNIIKDSMAHQNIIKDSMAHHNIIKKITSLPSEISVKKVPSNESIVPNLDLEKEIAASTLFKRNIEGSEPEFVEIVSNKPEDLKLDEQTPLKRSATEAKLDQDGSSSSKITII